MQFHPEVSHTPLGKEVLRNFLFNICGCKGDWTPTSFIKEEIEKIRDHVGPTIASFAGFRAASIRPSRRCSFTRPSATGRRAFSSITACSAIANSKTR